jgi:hypothetical protein
MEHRNRKCDRVMICRVSRSAEDCTWQPTRGTCLAGGCLTSLEFFWIQNGVVVSQSFRHCRSGLVRFEAHMEVAHSAEPILTVRSVKKRVEKNTTFQARCFNALYRPAALDRVISEQTQIFDGQTDFTFARSKCLLPTAPPPLHPVAPAPLPPPFLRRSPYT